MTPILITCEVLAEELRSLLPSDTPVEVLGLGLHCRPRLLHARLRDAVARADGVHDPILLGYGLCSQAVVGLVARRSTLVLPRTDDCLGVLLGSGRAHRDLVLAEPGSYFLTRGWIAAAQGTLVDDFQRLVARVGAARARAVMEPALRHYRRVIHIVLPGRGAGDARSLNNDIHDEETIHVRRFADTFGLEYRRMVGTNRLLRSLVEAVASVDAAFSGTHRPDTGNVLRVPPGVPVTLESFMSWGPVPPRQ